MAILESLKQFATGKSESERKQYAVRNRMIQGKGKGRCISRERKTGNKISYYKTESIFMAKRLKM